MDQHVDLTLFRCNVVLSIGRQRLKLEFHFRRPKMTLYADDAALFVVFFYR